VEKSRQTHKFNAPKIFPSYAQLFHLRLFSNFPLLPSDKNACLAMKNSIGLFAKLKRGVFLFQLCALISLRPEAISFQSLKNKTRAPLFLNGKFAFGRNWMAAEFWPY
jgi:hypothetical protein